MSQYFEYVDGDGGVKLLLPEVSHTTSVVMLVAQGEPLVLAAPVSPQVHTVPEAEQTLVIVRPTIQS